MVTPDPDQMHARRLAAYQRRSTRATARKVRASDVAPRRIGDGVKPEHRRRAVPVRQVFGNTIRIELGRAEQR